MKNALPVIIELVQVLMTVTAYRANAMVMLLNAMLTQENVWYVQFFITIKPIFPIWFFSLRTVCTTREENIANNAP